jgi:intracellular sulfur oxidation DsrE/DsrF family protein
MIKRPNHSARAGALARLYAFAVPGLAILTFAVLTFAVLAFATLASGARAQQVPLQDKPFAEHRLVLQLSDNDPKKQALVISVAFNLLKFYDPDKVAIEVVAFGPGIDLLRAESDNRKLVESLVAQGVRFDVCLNTVDSVERDTGKRPQILPAATPVQVGVAQILFLTENGYTLVRP